MPLTINKINILLLLIIGGFVGALVYHYVGINFLPKHIYLLNTASKDPLSLPPLEKKYLTSFIASGTIVSATDLLNNFTAYYHTLLGGVLTILGIAVGFLTFNAYKGKAEHDELLEKRCNDFFDNFERQSSSENLEGLLEKYENLSKYLKEKVLEIVTGGLTHDFIYSEIFRDEDLTTKIDKLISEALKARIKKIRVEKKATPKKIKSKKGTL